MPARRVRPRRSQSRGSVVDPRDEAPWPDLAAPPSLSRSVTDPPVGAGLAAVEVREGAAVLLLAPQQVLTFTGRCRLRCLLGAVRVLGFTVEPHQPPLPVLSPPTHCALSLEALPAAHTDARQLRSAARSALRAHRVRRPARQRVMARFRPGCAVLLLEHLDTALTRFLLSFPPLCRLFQPPFRRVPPGAAAAHGPRRPDGGTAHSDTETDPDVAAELALLAAVGIVPCGPERGLMLSDSATGALSQLLRGCCVEDEGVPVIMVCGPKSIGKSTFNRYLINLLLNHLPSVEYMECDIGQTEFTPPGCVSLSTVTEPFLGPPFTHQRTPRKMVYYGQSSCEQDTERYIDVVKYVFSSYRKEVPLVINTMGWVKGEGLLLLTDMIRLLSPTHVVQMDVYDWKAMAPLTPESVRVAPGLYTKGQQQGKGKRMDLSAAESWKCSEGEEDASAPDYKLLYVHPEFPGAGAAGEARVHSSILRDMSILGYLGQLQPPDVPSVLPLHSIVPYQVPFNAVALRVIHTDVAPSNIMYAVNASWVGLCRIPDEIRCQSAGPVLLTQTPICDCLGFGIVRGVDMEKHLYHILTPVPPQSLRVVNCLLLGNIAVPNCIFVSQEGIEGEIPYVTSEYNYSILGSGKLRKRKCFKQRESTLQCDDT
ncbi:polynucleotide 5'-hydroxyl-kinase NOL9 [Coturnix japonica]|uniref:polynucleotide 5'-hydroxyl-kinase NOL9 n=1 Tax=Coturnix japonica TaxID=93934 RepID=UPI000777CC34|nr:polynucleotide 5'-hydroxyl-kinase NOL9 [Coturnix japonica]